MRRCVSSAAKSKLGVFHSYTANSSSAEISAHDYLLVPTLQRAEFLPAAIVPPSISSSSFPPPSPPRLSVSDALPFRPSHLPSQLRKYILSSLCRGVFQDAICQHVMTLGDSKELGTKIGRNSEQHKTNFMIIYEWTNKNMYKKKKTEDTFCVNVNNVTR